MEVVVRQIAMTLENLEAEVLSLPKQSQATLLARMLERLGQSDEIHQEVASVWTEEAELRVGEASQNENRAMNDTQVVGTPAEQVFQRIHTFLS
jgi:hypothetical protein